MYILTNEYLIIYLKIIKNKTKSLVLLKKIGLFDKNYSYISQKIKINLRY